ncbi:PREDICTED: pentatricopeptide repeat-containing protein At1g09900-like [Camelina sativa]|uniref:Pentatricopeptide repeat-containing protein At1g09900-like n=1 Tax=Camelina sativa TaxID=90675 RepID=A0ABM1R5U3_CAMSA|nr:PREDICTED: pentatricopeptide repeat-containing protein At1g09900-like [Camelina sativa]
MLDEAIKFLNDTPSSGCQPNVITHNIILRSMCSTGRWMDAEKLLADMLRKGFSPSVVTFNILINFLCRKAELFDDVIFTTLIHGHSRSGRIDLMKESYEKMLSRGLQPDLVLYNTLVNGFCKNGDLVAARKIVDGMILRGLRPEIGIVADLASYKSLVNEIYRASKDHRNS